MIGIGIAGFGYWGPILARNFAARPDCRIVGVCDPDPARLDAAKTLYHPDILTTRIDELLSASGLDALLVAAPVSSHYALARAALMADKDVLVEKPMTMTAGEAEELLELAQTRQRVLGVDHTILYTGAVRKMKEVVESGALGQLKYLDFVRINLGLFQSDTNVLYDLAPHDLAVALHLVGHEPLTVQAMGATYDRTDNEYLAYIHLEFPGALVAHFHVNWLSPVKVRRTFVAGSEKMIVFDDLDQSEKVRIYDKGISVQTNDFDSLARVSVDYRGGDMVSPKIDSREPLGVEAGHFLDCLRRREQPLSDGRLGLQVVRILEAAQTSLRRAGAKIMLRDFAAANESETRG